MRVVMAVAIVSMGLLWSILQLGCVRCTDPEPLEERLVPIVEQFYEEVSRHARDDAEVFHPSETPIELHVISQNEVRVSYEKDGQEIIQHYAVSYRDTDD